MTTQTQTKALASIFPDLPREIPAVDKDGNFTALWSLGLSSLFQALQDNFSNEGITFPPLTSDQAATIQAIYAPYIGFPLPQDDPANNTQIFIPDISGKTIFNSTTRLPQQFIISYDASTPPNITSAKWWTFTLVYP
jgi:hypothetical protein